MGDTVLTATEAVAILSRGEWKLEGGADKRRLGVSFADKPSILVIASDLYGNMQFMLQSMFGTFSERHECKGIESIVCVGGNPGCIEVKADRPMKQQRSAKDGGETYMASRILTVLRFINTELSGKWQEEEEARREGEYRAEMQDRATYLEGILCSITSIEPAGDGQPGADLFRVTNIVGNTFEIYARPVPGAPDKYIIELTA